MEEKVSSTQTDRASFKSSISSCKGNRLLGEPLIAPA